MLRARVRAMTVCEAGVVATEFALMLVVLLPVVLLTVDTAYGSYVRMQLAEAVDAGLHYARIKGSSATVANIKNAVVNATGLSIDSGDITVEDNWYGCANLSTDLTLTQAASAPTCSDGSIAGQFVRIRAASSYTPLLQSYLGSEAIAIDQYTRWK